MRIRRKTHGSGAALLALVTLVVLPLYAHAQTFPSTISRPNSRGDQVLFFYDVRDQFTTFINVRNVGNSELSVTVLFYGPELETPFNHTLVLPVTVANAGQPPNGGLVTIDVAALRANGLPAQAGVAIATAVDSDGKPIVTRALAGNFTIANLTTGSAWGSAGAARSAVQNAPQTGAAECPINPPLPTPGTVIDGSTVALTPLQPGTADLAMYYDPATLAPASVGGNQLIFVNFEDVVSVPFRARTGSTTWSIRALRSNGAQLSTAPLVTEGVVVTDLVSVIGAGAVGSGGSVLFTAETAGARLNRLVFFTEALGTFGTGYLLPRR